MKDFIRNGETEMQGVREYGEGMSVRLAETLGLYVSNNLPYEGAGRLVIRAYNEGGQSATEVDLLDVLGWVSRHRPELLDGLLSTRVEQIGGGSSQPSKA